MNHRFNLRTIAGSIAVAVIASACATSTQRLQTATGDTRPEPVVVQVPVQVTDPALQSGCWAQLYTERDFKGEMATLIGPVEIETADRISGKELKRQVDSIVTGSKATLRVYEHAMFKDRTVAFGPNSRESGLITRLGLGGRIESLKLECSAQ